MKNIRCTLLRHEVEHFPPKERKENPNEGRSYLYIHGMKCTRCGEILSLPRAPGADEPLSHYEIAELARYNREVSCGIVHSSGYKEKMTDYQRRFDNLNMAGRDFSESST